jgi:D-alanyl-D-alanine carboxypeptidase/D-alanyl-D-alanine carboxypeptidase (penicillin-binding protein 5/6)
MNDGNDWNDHCRLIEDGFANFICKTIVSKGDVLGAVSVLSGTDSAVQLLATEDFSYALGANENPEICLPEPGFVYAPVVQGQSAGVVYVCLDGKPVGTVPVVYGQTVEAEKEQKTTLWDKLLKRR